MIVSHLSETDSNGTPPPPVPPARSQTLATSTVLAPPSPSIAKVISTAELSPASFTTIPALPANIDFKTDVWNQLKARNQCNISAVIFVISSCKWKKKCTSSHVFVCIFFYLLSRHISNGCSLCTHVCYLLLDTNLLEKDFERRRQIEELHAEISRLRSSHQGTHTNMRVSISSPALAPLTASPVFSTPPALLDSRRLSLASIPPLITHSALLENVRGFYQ